MAILIAEGPLILITATEPTPIGVQIAQMVSLISSIEQYKHISTTNKERGCKFFLRYRDHSDIINSFELPLKYKVTEEN